MFKRIQNFSNILLGSLFLISLVPFFYRPPVETPKKLSKQELYNPHLVRLNSVDKIITYVDSLYKLRSTDFIDTALYVSIISQTLKERFHFGLSNYTLSENWVACMGGKLLWGHLSGMVDPNDIVKHSNGLCSQQTIVFMEILKRKGIPERTLGLGYKEGPGHFLCEVHYNNAWHMHDITMEPAWKNIYNRNKSLAYYLNNKDTLYLAYQNIYSRPVFDKLLGKIVYGKVNEFPARKMLLFHQVTLLFTYALPMFFLFMFVRSTLKKRKDKKPNVASVNKNQLVT